MTLRADIETILKDVGKPLHAKEIYQELGRRGYSQPSGNTPENTIHSRIIEDMKKEGSPFEKVGPNTFGIRGGHVGSVDVGSSYQPNLVQHTPPRDDLTGSYSVDNILHDGCFIARSELDSMLERIRTKKCLILQGPPGTGKTWLAKRLAYALMRRRDDSKVRAVQFHPNYSYEDFVRGWRPAGKGKLKLVDGPFLEMIEAAKGELTAKYIVVIEEINRGHPAQIFGELLTLLEADKRTSDAALELSYRRKDSERVFIPDNLYVMGTMNIADRSIALVDLALRRRFAFITLKPTLGEPWRSWMNRKFGINVRVLTEIEKRIKQLNDTISADTSLGPQFCVGHSYVTPPLGHSIANARTWFRQVVNTEICPLLDEYWFDAPEKARNAVEILRKGF